jgi:ubiquinone/menaquinone biosynthesis C-methylase UbiE
MYLQSREMAATESVIKHEEIVELARLINKTQLLIRISGGLLPGLQPDQLQHVTSVLEIACGPGVWTLELARANPQMRVTGVDTSSLMITYARNILREQALGNAQYFHIPYDVTALPFDAASFDLMSMQCLGRFLKQDDWPHLLSACWHLLRPGGLIRLTELEVSLTNAPALEEMSQLFLRAMRLDGRSFSPSDRHLGLISELEPMLYAAGFQECIRIAQMVNYSYGTPFHDEWKKEILIFSKEVQPLLVQKGLATPADLDALNQRLHYEISIPTFHALQPLLTVYGIKARERYHPLP